MGACIADRIFGYVRQFEVFLCNVELQDVHPRYVVSLAQSLDLRCYYPQVLGHDGQLAERIAQCLENRVAGTGLPVARPRRLGSRRDGPVRLESAEVVDAHQVGQLRRGAHAIDPPAVSGCVMILPVVQGIAPELALVTEIIRRYPGDVARPPVFVELQDLAIRPCVGAVQRDVDRHVAEQAHAALTRVFAQCRPLAMEHALDNLDVFYLFLDGLLEIRQCTRVASRVFRPPFRPGLLAVEGLEDAEQGVVVQPPRVVRRAKGPVNGSQLRPRRFAEALGRKPQQSGLHGYQGTVVHEFPRQRCQFGDFGLREKSELDEIPCVYQQLVPGKRRERLVRRVAECGRSRRQELPHREPHVTHAVDKIACTTADFADTVRARQGRNVQAHAGRMLARFFVSCAGRRLRHCGCFSICRIRADRGASSIASLIS